MAAISPVELIISNARHLSIFAERNRDLPIVHFQQMGERTDIPARLKVFQRLKDLNAQIQQYSRQLQRGLGRGSGIVLSGLALGLERHLEGNIYAPIGNVVAALKQIVDFGRTLLPLPVAPPPAQAEIALPISGDAPPPIPIDDAVEEDVRQATIDDDTDRILEDRDNRIFHSETEKVAIVDSICSQLFANPNPWTAARDEANPAFFETFPALIEARLIQQGGPAADLTPAEKSQICALSFEQLADELGKVFDPSQELSPLMVKLVRMGKTSRLQNERLIYLGLSRREEIAQLNVLAPIHEALQKGIKTQSVAFIASVIETRLHEIGKEDLENLVAWLAGRGQTQILSKIFAARRADLDKDVYFEALANAQDWEHKETYDFLFAQYPHREPGAAKDLLIAFAFYGNEEGIRFLLSPEYPRGFSADSIDSAFKAALDRSQYSCLGAFLNAGVSPHDENLNRAFEELCDNNRFEELKPFLTPATLARIPDSALKLQNTFIRICEERDFESASFFLAPANAAFLDKNCAYVLLENLLYSLEWDELKKSLEIFVQFPLFDKLEPSHLTDIIKEAVQLGKTKFAIFFLGSRRRNDIDLEEILTAAASFKKWSTLLALLNHSTCQRVSGTTLTKLLLRPREDNLPVELMEKILAKNDPNDPISDDDLATAFKDAAQNRNTAAMKVLQRVVRLSIEEIESLLLPALDRQDFGAASILLSFPAILEAPPELISRIYFHAAQAGERRILDIPFLNLGQVSNGRMERALFAALDTNHVEAARAIYLERTPPFVNDAALRNTVLQAASRGREAVLKFLYHYFPDQMSRELTQEAFSLAEGRGHFETSAFLWERFLFQAARPKQTIDRTAFCSSIAKKRKRSLS